MSAVPAASVYLVKGDDAALVAQEVRGLLDQVVGDGDHALIVEEIGGGAGDELNVGAVVDACLTPPFLVDRRVVVVREAGRLLDRRRAAAGRGGAGPPPDDGAHPRRWGRDRSGAPGQGDRRCGPDHRRHDEQGGGAQGLVARPPASGAGEARAAGGRPVGGPRRAREAAQRVRRTSATVVLVRAGRRSAARVLVRPGRRSVARALVQPGRPSVARVPVRAGRRSATRVPAGQVGLPRRSGA